MNKLMTILLPIILVYSIQAHAGGYLCSQDYTGGKRLRLIDSEMTSEGVNKVFTLRDESIFILKPTGRAHLIKKNRKVINIRGLAWEWLGGIDNYFCKRRGN